MVTVTCLGCGALTETMERPGSRLWIVLCERCGFVHAWDGGTEWRAATEDDLSTVTPYHRSIIALAMREAPLSPERRSEIVEMLW